MQDFLTALGLVLVIEGVLYAAAPDAMRRMAARASLLSSDALRVGGMAALALGVGLVWLLRS